MIYNNIAYGFKKTLKITIVLLISLIIIASTSCFAYDIILKLQKLAVNWPIELLSLCGTSIAFGINASLLFFYIISILFNIIAIACCAGNAINIIKEDEQNGMIFHYINQPYSKTQIYIIKLIIALIYMFVQWFLYIASFCASIYIICIYFKMPFEQEIPHIISVAKSGIPILFFALALCLLYTTISANRLGRIYFLITTFTFSLLLGNMYKIFDLIAYYMRSGQIDDSTMISISETLIKLRLFFPFTLLNRLNTEKQPLPDSSIATYYLISILLITLCGYINITKSYESND